MLESECRFRFPASTLPRHLHSAFLLECSHEVLRSICGERAPYQTRVFAKVGAEFRELTQFMSLEQDIFLRAEGPHARQLGIDLPRAVEKVREMVFDEDGFRVDRQIEKGAVS